MGVKITNGVKKLLNHFPIYVPFYRSSCVSYVIAMQHYIINISNVTPTKPVN